MGRTREREHCQEKWRGQPGQRHRGSWGSVVTPRQMVRICCGNGKSSSVQRTHRRSERMRMNECVCIEFEGYTQFYYRVYGCPFLRSDGIAAKGTENCLGSCMHMPWHTVEAVYRAFHGYQFPRLPLVSLRKLRFQCAPETIARPDLRQLRGLHR